MLLGIGFEDKRVYKQAAFKGTKAGRSIDVAKLTGCLDRSTTGTDCLSGKTLAVSPVAETQPAPDGFS
jgi:hypothetical protein